MVRAGDVRCMCAHFIEWDMTRLAARGLSIKEGALAFLRPSVLGSWRAAARRERKGLGGENGGGARRCSLVAASSLYVMFFPFITPASQHQYTGSIETISRYQFIGPWTFTVQVVLPARV